MVYFFFFKQKTAYEMRISDWSSDVCSSDLFEQLERLRLDTLGGVDHHHGAVDRGQRAIGVLAEILVPRRVEQVEDEPPMLEGHDRRCYRNAALLLDIQDRKSTRLTSSH